jgi:hypothetical protein
MTMAPAVIAALIGAGTAGTEMGLQASGALTPSTSGSAADLAKQTAAQEQQMTQEKQQALRQAAPFAQEQTGGYTADPATSALIASIAGSPADIGLAQQTVFGGAQQPNIFEATQSPMSTPGLATTQFQS